MGIYTIKTYSYAIMPIRTTVYFDEKLLSDFDSHIGLVRRSTAIAKLMKNELEHGGGLNE